MQDNKIKVELENCYGIKRLVSNFDFSTKSSYVIYAPNGVMKSSFAQVFQDIANGTVSSDRIFKDKTTTRVVTDGTNADILKECVFVIEPYNQQYKSTKISTLLVNKDLKDQYDKIYQDIDDKKEILLKELKSSSGLKSGIEEEIAKVFTNDPKELFKALSRIKAEVFDHKSTPLDEIQYQRIFNEKVLELLDTKDFKASLAEYIKTYDQIVSSSTFFKKGIFNHNNAADIAKNLKDNGFFKANHSIYISSENARREVKTEAELETVIQKEKDEILQNPALTKSFEDVDKKLTKNKDLRDFRDYVEKNKLILNELDNLDKFKQTLWVGYLAKHVAAFKNLIDAYEVGKAEIEKIVAIAKLEQTKWINVINIFNERFSVPFVVKMANQEDVILKSEAPNITFEFKDGENGKSIPVNEGDLVRVLSNGEKRALYILNIIFEVEARKEAQQKTLFIIDDIADSFDYKNKYAIVEYLKDISDEKDFYQIILTHNFDFYRTISGRLNLERKNKLHTIKSNDAVKLTEEKYQKNPFIHWKENLNNDEMLIASIPFVRNLAEYCGYETCELKLTSLLHIKNDTATITVGDLGDLMKEVLIDKKTLALANPQRKVKELIYNLANAIKAETAELMELEKKIVLSIAIRLKAEEFLISKINDATFAASITSNQTIVLIEKFKEKFPTEHENISLMKQVNLMTPENIHLNSFMYEPILDLANGHLKQLYTKLCTLTP